MKDLPSRTYRLDEQVGYVLRRVSQRHAQIFQDLAPEGLTPTQFAALIRLSEVGPTSQNQLGRHTAMDVATIKGVVARLSAKGLVTVTADPEDKRRTVIELTDAAEDLMPQLHNIGFAITDATLEPLSEEERLALSAVLEKLT